MVALARCSCTVFRSLTKHNKTRQKDWPNRGRRQPNRLSLAPEVTKPTRSELAAAAMAGAKPRAMSSQLASAPRKVSWLGSMERHTEEEEFFSEKLQHQRKGSLAGIAAQQALMRNALGSITFQDEAMEREWRKCVSWPRHRAAQPQPDALARASAPLLHRSTSVARARWLTTRGVSRVASLAWRLSRGVSRVASAAGIRACST